MRSKGSVGGNSKPTVHDINKNKTIIFYNINTPKMYNSLLVDSILQLIYIVRLYGMDFIEYIIVNAKIISNLDYTIFNVDKLYIINKRY